MVAVHKLVDRVIGLMHFGNNLTILRGNQSGALAINHLDKGIICQILKAASGESKPTNRFSNGQSMAIEKPKISIITAIQNSLCQFLILYFSANLRRMLLKTTVISAMSKSIIRRRTSLYMIIFSPYLSSKCRQLHGIAVRVFYVPRFFVRRVFRIQQTCTADVFVNHRVTACFGDHVRAVPQVAGCHAVDRLFASHTVRQIGICRGKTVLLDAHKLIDRVKGILRYAHGIRHHGSKQAVPVIGIHGVRAAEGCIQIAVGIIGIDGIYTGIILSNRTLCQAIIGVVGIAGNKSAFAGSIRFGNAVAAVVIRINALRSERSIRIHSFSGKHALRIVGIGCTISGMVGFFEYITVQSIRILVFRQHGIAFFVGHIRDLAGGIIGIRDLNAVCFAFAYALAGGVIGIRNNGRFILCDRT